MPKSDEQKITDKRNYADSYRDEQRKKIANGENLCATARCTNPPVEGKTKCQFHIDYDKTRMKKYRAEKKAEREAKKEWNKENPNEKKCTYCPRPNDTDGDMCSVCLEKTRKAYAEEKQWKEEYNLEHPEERMCSVYNCDKIVHDDKQMCLDCRNKAVITRHAKEEDIKTNGSKIFLGCFHPYDEHDPNNEEEHFHCQDCREKRRDRQRENKLELLEYNLLHPDEKICNGGNHPNTTEYDYCDECREKNTKQHKDRREKIVSDSDVPLCIKGNHPIDDLKYIQCSECREKQRKGDRKKVAKAKAYNEEHEGESKMCVHCNDIYTTGLEFSLCPKDNARYYSFENFVKSYKKGADKRELEFELTNDDIRELINGNCYYCGQKPDPLKKIGIDRKNNDIGYLIDNVVSCCKMCNMMKHIVESDIFIKQCIHRVQYWYETCDDKQLNHDIFECSNYNGINTDYGKHMYGAGKRNITNHLSLKDYGDFIIGECYYCGKESDLENEKRNGIDRMDSNSDYKKDLCVSCCKTCNISKKNYTVDDFINKCIDIAKIHYKKEKIGKKQDKKNPKIKVV
jgi:hypothetical protein